MKRVFGLDVLRSLAIVEVLLGHGMTLYIGEGAKKLFEGFYGFLGVELFFVLSGFLIGSIALAAFERGPSPFVLGDFLARRWLRTLPNYYLFLGVNAALAVWLGGGAFHARYLVFLQNLYWPMAPFFGESWSLAVEEVFYLVLPLLLVLVAARARGPHGVLAALCGALVAFTVVRLAYVSAHHPAFYDVVRKTSGLRLDSLMYGVVAAWLNRYAQTAFLNRRGITFVAGVLLVIAAVRLVVTLAPVDPMGASIALCGVSLGAAFTLPFLSTWQAAPGPVRSAFEWTSRVSYALYLCHLPTSRVLQHFGVGRGLGPLLVWIGASCLVATVVHHGFERPFLRLRDRLPGPAVGEPVSAETQPA